MSGRDVSDERRLRRLAHLASRRHGRVSRREAADVLRMNVTDLEVWVGTHGRDLCEFVLRWTISGPAIAWLNPGDAHAVKTMNRRVATAINGGDERWRAAQAAAREEAAGLAAKYDVDMVRLAAAVAQPARPEHFDVRHDGGVRRPIWPAARERLPSGFGESFQRRV